MRTKVWMTALCAVAVSGLGRAQTKIGIINYQEAVLRTQEGQKAAKALEEKYAPRQQTLEKKFKEIEDLKAQGRKGQNTMSEEARTRLLREIDQKEKSLTRDNEDARADFQQDQTRLLSPVWQKMQGEVDKYAKEKGYALVLDFSSLPENSVVFALNSINITDDVVGLYDKTYGSGGAVGASPAPGAKPSVPVVKPPSAPLTRPPVAAPKPPVVRPGGPGTPPRP